MWMALAALGCADNHVGSSPESDGDDPTTIVRDGVTAKAYLRGDNVIISLESEAPVYTVACTERTKLEKLVGTSWQPLRNDAPADFHQGYFVDDRYEEPTFGLGCDVQYCMQANGGANAGPPNEIIADGTRAKPSWVTRDNAVDPAPVFRTEPLSGPIRASLTYFKDAQCKAPETVSFELDIASEGVCCPVGPAGCSSSGPLGGWAATLETCDDSGGSPGEYSELVVDNRGCEKLRIWWNTFDHPETAACAAP